MEDREDKLFFHVSDSRQKFDQFIGGVLALSAAYLVQGYRPTKIGFWPPTSTALEALALLLLFVGLIACIRKIEMNIEINRLSIELTRCQRLRMVLDEKPASIPAISASTLSPLSPEQERAKRAKLDEDYRNIENAQRGFSRAQYRWYWIRNATGTLGFVLLIAARIAAAY